MPDHYCRTCGCLLTLENIYHSNFKKHNWVCKSCDNSRRRSSSPVIAKPQYNPEDVAFKSVSASNFVKSTIPPTTTITYCQLCTAYDEQSGTCHLNPPPFPRVFKDDWCQRFVPLQ